MNDFKMPKIPTAQKTDPKTKVPSGVKNTQKKIPAPIPAEADAVPSKILVASLPARANPIAAVFLTRGITGYLERFTKKTSRVSLCRHLASTR